ncbi:DUF2158 domain-containing protein [Aeromonas veronii]|uniref:DUF2158 domain-containing protein n=1 Tax=Aeromonas veronii TaxID=654 RepID=UPI003CE76790
MINDVNFYPGQLVVLRSGSPVMTINSIYNNGENVASCRWFASEACSEDFYVSVLKPHTVQSLQPHENMEFSVGDVVHLRSDGSPAMTIESIRDDDSRKEVNCIWFDKTNPRKSSSASFHPNALYK